MTNATFCSEDYHRNNNRILDYENLKGVSIINICLSPGLLFIFDAELICLTEDIKITNLHLQYKLYLGLESNMILIYELNGISFSIQIQGSNSQLNLGNITITTDFFSNHDSNISYQNKYIGRDNTVDNNLMYHSSITIGCNKSWMITGVVFICSFIISVSINCCQCFCNCKD
jgi:hypothetical protein